MLKLFFFSAHWGERLETYITQFNGLVKLFRNARREGLIRARSIGAKKSTGEVRPLNILNESVDVFF